ncbi:diguanylate cyclase [bacterium]|nr:MAG: diguanylate cyclase [bacterium]
MDTEKNGQALIDDLTGVSNRRAFWNHLNKILATSKEGMQGFYVVVTDLDHFKHINDTYGHLTGDHIIKEFSKVITESAQKSASVVARYGGDEFVLILEGIDRDQAKGAMEQARTILSTREFLSLDGDRKIALTLSVGIAEYPGDGKTPDELFAKADEALYSSKQLGRNKVSFAKDILGNVREEKKIQNRLLKPDFIGRKEEICGAENLLFSASTHKLIIVNGEVGVGKSRFLEEIYSLSKRKKAEVFLMSCSALDQERPYVFLSDILNLINQQYPQQCNNCFQSLASKQKAALSTLGKLKSITGRSQPDVVFDLEMRMSLFEGLTELFQAVIFELKPIILVDNFDFIDQASVEVITCLMLSEKDVPLRICASDSRLKSQDTGKGSFLDDLVLKVLEFEIISKVNLAYFSRAETITLIQHIFAGTSVPAAFSEKVYQTTEGSSFFIVELLRDLLARRIIYLQYPRWIFRYTNEPFPKSLKDLLLLKFKRLSEEERELVLAVAGMGGTCKFEFLSKLKKLNNGYIQDVVEREAGDIFRKSEADAQGRLFFKSEFTRSLFYGTVDEDSRIKLHESIAAALEEENKDNVEPVSAELAFHFSKAQLTYKAKIYAARAASYAQKLFSDQEIDQIVDKVMSAKDARNKTEPIREEAWPQVIEIIGSLNAAIKNMHVYQGTNELSIRMAHKCILAIQYFFKIQKNLTFSNPHGSVSEENALLINGQRLYSSSSIGDVVSKRLLSIMRDFSISSITFRENVREAELLEFISIILDHKRFAEQKKAWSKILLERNIHGIKIDEMIYKIVALEEDKKQLREEVMKDLIKKTISSGAANINTDPLVKEGVFYKKRAFTPIEEVKSIEKNILLKSITHIPDDIVVETIAEEYSQRKNNILDIKEMVLVFLKSRLENDKLITMLRGYLGQLGMSEECLQWLIDPEDFSKESLHKGANIYLATDAKTLLEMGVSENLIPTLGGLFAAQEDATALKIIDKYLINLKSKDVGFRAYSAVTIVELMNIVPATLLGEYLEKIVASFLDTLQNEDDEEPYGFMLNNVGWLLERLLERENYQGLGIVLSAIRQVKETTGAPEWRQSLAVELFEKFNVEAIMHRLLPLMDKIAQDQEKNSEVIGIFRQLMPRVSIYLIDFLTKRASGPVLFEWYLQDMKIMELLRDFKEEIVGEIESLAATENEAKVDTAFRILHYFNDPQLLYMYEKPLRSQNRDIQRCAVDSLLKFTIEGSVQVLEKIILNSEPKKQKDLISLIGKCGFNTSAVDFLERLMKLEGQASNKKDLSAAIAAIKKKST